MIQYAPKIIAPCDLFTLATASFNHYLHDFSGLQGHDVPSWSFANLTAMLAAVVWPSGKYPS